MTNTIKLKRGSGSDPAASDMVVGEPVLRSDTAELFFKKDDGSVAKVSGGGGGGSSFQYLALRNAANDGAASYPANDFTLVTSGTTTAVSPVTANALILSYGGVVQKPNSGTSTSGITGFIVDGSRLKTATNFAAAPDFIVYQESGGIGEPSDNTVTSAKIVDGAIVNADINASAAIAGTKISPDFGSQNITTTGVINGKDLTLSDATPKIQLTDSNADSDFSLELDGGLFQIRDTTNDAYRLKIASDGTVTIGQNLDALGGIDVTGVTNLSGELRANGNIRMSNSSPKITFTDAQDNPDFEVGNLNGIFRIRDITNSVNRLVVNTDGHVDVLGNLDVGAGLDVTGTCTATDFSGGKISLYDNGSTSPTVLIATDDGSPYALQIRNDGVSNAASSGLHFWQNNSGIGNIRIHGATAYLPIAISQKKVDTNDDKTALYIDASQNVGIGTVTPTDLLDLFSSTNNSRLLRLSHPTSPTAAAGFLGFTTDGTTDNNIVTLGCMYSSTYYNVLNIQRSTRNVGIGTNSPDQKLHIYESATDSQCYLHVQNNRSRNAAIKFTTTQGSWYAGQGIGADVDRFMIYDSAEKFSVDANGHAKIHDGDLVISTSGNGIRANGPNNSTYGELKIQVDVPDGSGSNNEATFKKASSGIALAFPSGGGIDFSANANATGHTSNLFDDYESGTWTASMVTGTCSDSSCKYIKIGNQVTVWGRVHSFSDTSTNIILKIQGLPYAVNTSNAGGNSFQKHISTEANCPYVTTNETISFYGHNTANAWQYVTHLSCSSGAYIYFYATYRSEYPGSN